MIEFRFRDTYGQIILGPLRIAWWNKDEYGDYGWTSFSFHDYNLEVGQIDQDRPGLYITKYDRGEVDRIKTIFSL